VDNKGQAMIDTEQLQSLICEIVEIGGLAADLEKRLDKIQKALAVMYFVVDDKLNGEEES